MSIASLNSTGLGGRGPTVVVVLRSRIESFGVKSHKASFGLFNVDAERVLFVECLAGNPRGTLLPKQVVGSFFAWSLWW